MMARHNTSCSTEGRTTNPDTYATSTWPQCQLRDSRESVSEASDAIYLTRPPRASATVWLKLGSNVPGECMRLDVVLIVEANCAHTSLELCRPSIRMSQGTIHEGRLHQHRLSVRCNVMDQVTSNRIPLPSPLPVCCIHRGRLWRVLRRTTQVMLLC